jgi:hypothetical protein
MKSVIASVIAGRAGICATFLTVLGVLLPSPGQSGCLMCNGSDQVFVEGSYVRPVCTWISPLCTITGGKCESDKVTGEIPKCVSGGTWHACEEYCTTVNGFTREWMAGPVQCPPASAEECGAQSPWDVPCVETPATFTVNKCWNPNAG